MGRSSYLHTESGPAPRTLSRLLCPRRAPASPSDRSELTSSHPPSEPTSRPHPLPDVTRLKAAMLPAPWGSPCLPP